MDFILTEEQQLLADTVARYVARLPIGAGGVSVSGGPSPDEIWRSLAELGLLGINVPEEFAGIGADPVATMITMERFGEGLLAAPYVPTAVVAAFLFDHFGTENQRSRHLPAIANGTTRWAIACHEAEGRYDLDAISTKVERRSGHVMLRGRKSLVIGGDRADGIIVSARSSEEVDSISLYVVPSTAPGIGREAVTDIDGHGSADIVFDDVVLAADALLGRRGEGLPLLRDGLDRGIAALCAEAVGAMSKLAVLTFAYLQTRRQFSQPLCRFQALQHRAAEIMTAIEQSRSITYFATSRLQNPDPEQRHLAVSAAKATVGRHARFVGQQAVQLHGAIGVTEELPVGKYFKRLTAFDLIWGDAAHHSELYGNGLVHAPQSVSTSQTPLMDA